MKFRERESSKLTPEQQEINKRIAEWYGLILEDLSDYDYTPTMADAAFLREKLRECYQEDTTAKDRSMSDEFAPWDEAIARWVYQMYGIDYENYVYNVGEGELDKNKKIEVRIEARKKLFADIKMWREGVQENPVRKK